MNKIGLVLNQNIVGSFIGKKIDLALSVHGINFTEFLLIYQLGLAQNFSLSRVSLSEKIALTPSGVTKILHPMEKLGIIEKKSNPRDARQSLVMLSIVGQELLKDSTKTVELTADSIYSLLNDDEVATLSSLLNKLKI